MTTRAEIRVFVDQPAVKPRQVTLSSVTWVVEHVYVEGYFRSGNWTLRWTALSRIVKADGNLGFRTRRLMNHEIKEHDAVDGETRRQMVGALTRTVNQAAHHVRKVDGT